MYAFIIDVINALIRGIGTILKWAFALLPDSPFQKYVVENSVVLGYLKYINFFLPVAEIIVVLEAFCTAVAVYYVVQIVLRWTKAIE